MQTYKALDNSLHVIEPEFAYMLPEGCVPITEEEANEIRAEQEAARQAELATYVPPQVTRAQGKAVLIQMGRWQHVLDFVAAIQDPTQRAIAEVALNDTQNWERSSPFLNQAAQALGMTDEQLDDLFRAAAQVRL